MSVNEHTGLSWDGAWLHTINSSPPPTPHPVTGRAGCSSAQTQLLGEGECLRLEQWNFVSGNSMRQVAACLTLVIKVLIEIFDSIFFFSVTSGKTLFSINCATPLLKLTNSYMFDMEGLERVPSITSKSMPGRRSVVFDFLSVKER